MAKRDVKQGNQSSGSRGDEVASALRANHTDVADTTINALVEGVIELVQMEPHQVVEP